MEVRLPNVPEHMAPGLAEVAQFVALIFGLRVATSEMRCCPLGGQWVGEQPEVSMSQALWRGTCGRCVRWVSSPTWATCRAVPRRTRGRDDPAIRARCRCPGRALRVPTRHELHRRIHPDPRRRRTHAGRPEPHAELENLGAMFPA